VLDDRPADACDGTFASRAGLMDGGERGGGERSCGAGGGDDGRMRGGVPGSVFQVPVNPGSILASSDNASVELLLAERRELRSVVRYPKPVRATLATRLFQFQAIHFGGSFTK